MSAGSDREQEHAWRKYQDSGFFCLRDFKLEVTLAEVCRGPAVKELLHVQASNKLCPLYPWKCLIFLDFWSTVCSGFLTFAIPLSFFSSSVVLSISFKLIKVIEQIPNLVVHVASSYSLIAKYAQTEDQCCSLCGPNFVTSSLTSFLLNKLKN